MFDQIMTIVRSIIDSFLHIWPYLLVTIPLAVAVQMSGASRYINRAFQGRLIPAILLATAVGAFSPFCSCGVIPVVAALLISGVPLAPVMSFWIASPSMDPEVFFLSVAALGWELAVWRLAGTLALSLTAGLVTHFAVQRGWLGRQVLRPRKTAARVNGWQRLKRNWRGLPRSLARPVSSMFAFGGASATPAALCCSTGEPGASGSLTALAATVTTPAPGNKVQPSAAQPGSCPASGGGTCAADTRSFWQRLLSETCDATLMVVKFMALAFFLSAIIRLYVPAQSVAGLLGGHNPWAIVTAAMLGVPAYASNLTALPMVSALLAQGMQPSAALAFLIAGPTTTLPALAAVWGLASRRVVALYISFALIGAVALGYIHSLATTLF